jgi:FlaA1/EpsC-like NDP-sugar epimerase
MTRFNISLQEGVDMVLWAIEHAHGGELFVPKIPSYRITDVARALAPNAKQVIVGIRPGEKIHEEMITASDSQNTVDLGSYYAILSTASGVQVDDYCEGRKAVPVPLGFAYNSGTNPVFLTVEEIRALVRRHVKPDFEV